MHIHIKLTEAIINECLVLHYRQNPASKGLVRKLYLIPAFLLILAVYLIIDDLQQPAIGFNFLMAIMYTGFAISYYFFMKKRLLPRAKSMLRNLGQDAQYEVDATVDQLTTKTYRETFTNSWQSFTKALAGADNVLLYQLNDSFSMFNRSFFEPGDFEKFKIMVQDHITPTVAV